MEIMIITNHTRAALQQIATQTANSFQAQICTIFPLTNGNFNESPVFGGENASSINQHDFLEFSHTLTSKEQPFYLNSLDHASREFENVFCVLQPYAIKAFLAIPMVAHDNLYGTLALFFTTPRHFSEKEILHLSTVANTAALTLDLNGQEKPLQHESRSSFESILTKSKVMHLAVDVMKKAAITDANVLIFGESGVGKELIARGIHNLSRRNKNAFIPVDCVALPTNLLESELFGFEKGAFTGAISRKHGLFELAEQGTFFLDEICELDSVLQAKLLRVLQERQFRRIGGKDLINVDVRVISATNRNPEAAVREKILREDLYFRLNVIPIHVPALRERKEDILPLADYFIEKFIHANGLGPKELTPEATQLLLNYDWPGNVRELQNIMERMVSLCSRNIIVPEDLPACIRKHPANAITASAPVIQLSKSWRENLSAFKHTYFEKLLEQTHGDILEAARQAKVSPRTLYRFAHKV
jgi:transcriptional regulator with PAS, ATPase and Fis domain